MQYCLYNEGVQALLVISHTKAVIYMRDDSFPYEVIVDGKIIPADFRAEGEFNLEPNPNGVGECLVYCERCTNSGLDRDPCLAQQMFAGNHVFVKLTQFK